MKLVTYDQGKGVRAGLAIESVVVDLEKAARALLKAKLPASVRELLAQGDKSMALARKTADKCAALLAKNAKRGERLPAWMIPDDEAHLGPPVPDPEKVIGLGLSYLDHITEQEARFQKKLPVPENPIIFSKFASALVGPYDPIQLPPERVTREVDFEVELALVIGRPARGVGLKAAADCVAGYMVMNDVSARDCQLADRQWDRAKSFDTFAPCGPWLMTADEVGNPHRHRLWTAVNGQNMQDSSTGNLIFKIQRIVSYISEGISLKPGDIISTGTPAGVGMFRDPPIFLKPGDVVECGIEGIGIICNTCERRK